MFKKSAAPSGYFLTKSLRFRKSATAYLSRTFTTPTNQKIWTWSGWVKRANIGSTSAMFGGGLSGSNYGEIYFSGDALNLYDAATGAQLITSAVYRDPSSWYHVVVAVDTTQATAANRMKMYVNGSQITAFATAIYPSQNANLYINSSNIHSIGSLYYTASNTDYLDGYQAEINFIDGQQLTASSFGSTNATTGVWQPAKYTGTYGTNGFYLPFTNTTSTTTLGYDSSGNSNNWTTNNFSLTAGSTYDSMTDVPTLTSSTVANYAVLNPLNKGGGTVTDGNLQNNGSGWSSSMTTISFPATGNFYCEMTGVSVAGAAQGVSVGILNPEYNLISYADAIGNQPLGYGWYSYGGKTYNNSIGTTYNGGATYTTNDIIGIQLNNGTLTFYKNGTSQGTAYSGITGNYCFAVSCYGTDKIALNCGQRPFAYTPPTGSVALNTYNLPTSTIVKGASYMNATLYNGNGGTQTISNGNFYPDFTWIKVRNVADDHFLYDSVRGATKYLSSDTTAAEGTIANGLTAFTSTGFTLGDSGSTNNASNNFVGWQWNAGSGSSSSNTNGSITSTVSVNTTAGFSVVTYTGTGSAATIGHGLGVAPSMIIIKKRSASGSPWEIYHASLGNGKALYLNTTSAEIAASDWQYTSPTSSVWSMSNSPDINGSGSTYVAYCWAEIAGFSKFGSYTGNGSTDGPFVYCGFRPKFVMYKRADSTGNWQIFDTSRDPSNNAGDSLFPNITNAETSGYSFDILSNGFKQRDNGAGQNANGGTYVYAAFAENPLKFSLAR